jgi:hypothetical protein
MARSRGLPKSPQARYAKWQAKYDPTVVQSRFNEVSSVAQARAQAGIIAAAQAQQEIGAILDQYGVAGPARAIYLSFGMKVWHATQRLTGPALSTEVNGLTQYWQTAYGANPTVLNAIAQALGITALSY